MGRYQADSSDSTKSGPKALPQDAFSKVTLPGILIVQDRPDHVLINQTGSFYFATSTTASIGGTDGNATYTKATVAPTTSYLPVKLDFNPVAWSGSANLHGGAEAITGDVTFVYQGGL